MTGFSSLVYSHDVVEFVTVAVEYCVYLEQGARRKRSQLVDTMQKLLPLLYLKASMLPDLEEDDTYLSEQLVTEADYDAVRNTVAQIMGEQDDYLDVFVEDMKYSAEPIRKNISEDLADIYQSVRNFVGIYKMGVEDTMYGALSEVAYDFRLNWGQTLVNTLRAIHDVKYNQTIEETENEDDLCQV